MEADLAARTKRHSRLPLRDVGAVQTLARSRSTHRGGSTLDRWRPARRSWRAPGQPPPRPAHGAGPATSEPRKSCAGTSWPRPVGTRATGTGGAASAPPRRRTTSSSCRRRAGTARWPCPRELEMWTATSKRGGAASRRTLWPRSPKGGRSAW